MKRNIYIFLFFFLFSSCQKQESSEESLQEQALQLSQKFIIVDGHIDYPHKQLRNPGDISKLAEGFEFDFEKAKKGGLDAPFMSIYIPSQTLEEDRKPLVDTLISFVSSLADNFPDKFSLAYSPTDIAENFKKGKISLPMGMENGSPIAMLEDVDTFFTKGIRYVTLTHAKDNQICDSSYDTAYTHNGLSAFGEEVVRKMNQVGMMIDISHVSDSAFYDVMKISTAPAIASHSSCRHFVPGFERNMDDEMIKLLAKNGGVIQINFGSTFVDSTSRRLSDERRAFIKQWVAENNPSEEEKEAFTQEYNASHPVFTGIEQVAKNIDHVVQLVGIDHVAFGSDFDGVGDTLPKGLKDVSAYPNLIYELLKMGYKEEDIEKICYLNVFRVWKEVEEIAKTF